MTIELKSNAPEIDKTDPQKSINTAWERHRDEGIKLVNPANKRKYNVIIVGTGLAGASAAATCAELGYNVKNFCFQDSPRRAHSIAAQGGINAAKNYQNDGDSIYRLFYDTVKGGDFRSREANVYRLAQVSVNIIDQAVAQGVPFAREYGGLLNNRSFGGALVSRTFYAKGQTGQQLLLGAYSAMNRQIGRGKIKILRSQGAKTCGMFTKSKNIFETISERFLSFRLCFRSLENFVDMIELLRKSSNSELSTQFFSRSERVACF